MALYPSGRGVCTSPLAVAALADDDRAVEICNAPVTISDADAELPLTSTASGKSGSIGSDSVRYTRRESSVRPLVLTTSVPFGTNHAQYLHGFLHDAAAVAAVIEDQPLQLALRTQSFDGCPHILVATFGEIAVADVPDAFVHPSRVGYARNGDPFALQSDGLGAARQVFDGHPDLAARVSLEARADLLGGEALGIFAVDGEDLVADLSPARSAGDPL